MKAQTQRREQNPASTTAKCFSAINILEKQKVLILTGKCREFVAEITHHESKRLCENSAISTNYMRLAVDSTTSFKSFANGIKVSSKHAACEIYSEVS